MGTLFDARDRESILERVARLAPDARPVWGRFTPGEVVCYVASGDFRLALLCDGPRCAQRWRVMPGGVIRRRRHIPLSRSSRVPRRTPPSAVVYRRGARRDAGRVRRDRDV